MLLWCRSGSGQVWVDDQEMALPPGGFGLLPWGCAIRYRAARRQPFLVAGVHLIPRLRGVFQAGVAHAPGHPLAGSSYRQDDPALPRSLLTGRLDDHPELGALAEHLAHAWQRRGPPKAELARAQGAVFFAALSALTDVAETMTLPGELQRIDEAVRRHLDRIWDLPRLAETAGCSQAWLTRLTRRHWRKSPCRWLQCLRLEEARRLLASGGLAVAEVAIRVGIADRHRFSRVFHANYGVPPRSWRRDHRGP